MPYISLQHRFIVFLLILLCTQIVSATEQEVKVAVLSIWDEETTEKMWQPTVEYLNKAIPHHHFKLIPIKSAQIEQRVKSNAIDFIITNPANYVELEANFGISRLATLKKKYNKQIVNQLSAVIFTHVDRNDINTLNDLRNKSFMAVENNDLAGFQIAWLAFKKTGINPFKDFSKLEFSGYSQDKNVYSVLNKKIDAATIPSGILESMANDGLIDLNKLKILNRQSNEQFPLLHSTALYPEWPIAKLKNTSNDLTKDVTSVLLNLPANSLTVKTSHNAGWSEPMDYSQVRHLLKELNLPPFNIVEAEWLEEHWKEILLLLIFIFPALLIYIRELQIASPIDKKQISQSEIQWSTALDFLDEPIYMVDLEDKIIRANKAFYKLINSTSREADGKKVTDFTHPEGEETPCRVCQARSKLIDTVITLEPDDPENKMSTPLEISIQVIRDENRQAIAIVQKIRDLSEERDQQKHFRRNERLFTELLDATPDPLLISNADGTIVLVNSQFEKQIGFNREEIVGHKIEKLVPTDFQPNHKRKRETYNSGPAYRPMNKVDNLFIMHKDNGQIPVDISLTPFTIDNEKLIITTIHDISKRIKKEKEFKRLASFAELDPNPVIEFKENGIVTYVNQAALDVFPDIKQSQHLEILDITSSMPELNSEYEVTRDIEVNGSTFEQKIIYNPDTELYRTYVWDITKIRTLTKKMTYLARHDSLTNLINRRELERRLQSYISDAKENNKTHSLCYMDLDKFKVVNDTCGHVAGDELLKQISETINTKVRDTDTFARLGGDEFALLLQGCSLEKASAIAESIRLSIEQYRFHWDNKTFKIGVSIGIVSIDNTSGTIKNIQTAADTACYIAKEQGRNRVHIYQVGSDEITSHANENVWLNKINTALDKNDFVLYFQKIASVTDNHDVHYEVLVRMKDNKGNTIPPGLFIPSAERFNIMSSIDSWVIKNTLPILQNKKYNEVKFSINLSAQSLCDMHFMQDCIDKIKSNHISPQRICFEITETAMIANLKSAIQSVTILRDLGCTIALDDFGSGLSSFAYLKNLPVDYLKIDGSLIKDLNNDSINVTMVNSINHIGHSMGLKTIAEYVENDAVLNILRDMGVDYVQGYGIAKPVPLEDIDI